MFGLGGLGVEVGLGLKQNQELILRQNNRKIIAFGIVVMTGKWSLSEFGGYE